MTERAGVFVRTEFEWTYTPEDLFESRTVLPLPGGELTIDAGKGTYSVSPPRSTDQAADEVLVVFELRQLQTRRAYTLRGPSIVHHGADGSRHIVITAEPGEIKLTGHPVEFRVTDAAGNVVRDSRAERIAADTEFLARLAPKVARSPTLRAMVTSYGQAVRDQGDERVHLYEVLDAAKAHCGKNPAAIEALDVAAVWDVLGRLSNDPSLRQSRHRGARRSELRDATVEELTDARQAALAIIEAFAATLMG